MSSFELQTETHISHEDRLVQDVFSIDPAQLNEAERAEYDGLVEIVGLFTDKDLQTGQTRTISPSRVSAIPAITARHCELMLPARGQLSPQQVVEAWRGNIPENHGRHPDLLFDLAQYNFGTDDPLDNLVRGLTRAEQRRADLLERYKSAARRALTRYRYNQPIDDERSEELVTEIAEDHLKHISVG